MKKSSLKNNKLIIISIIIIISLWELISMLVENQIIMPGIKNIAIEFKLIVIH